MQFPEKKLRTLESIRIKHTQSVLFTTYQPVPATQAPQVRSG